MKTPFVTQMLKRQLQTPHEPVMVGKNPSPFPAKKFLAHFILESGG